MKKIPTLLVRNPDNRAHVLDEVTPGCEWVFAGEGVATRKYDGTCVMKDTTGKWFARREVKPNRPFPPNFIEEEYDSTTGKTVGWEPMDQSSFVKYFLEADRTDLLPGTYELIGPKVNGNPERVRGHTLVRHGDDRLGIRSPWTVDQVKALVYHLGGEGVEGVVWHHPDGRMAKLKARDIPASANADSSEGPKS